REGTSDRRGGGEPGEGACATLRGPKARRPWRLQRVLAGSRKGAEGTNVSDCGSAGWEASGLDAGREKEGRCRSSREAWPLRRTGGLTVAHALSPLGAAHYGWREPVLSDCAGSRLRGDKYDAAARQSHHPHGRTPTSSAGRSPVEWGLARPLGGHDS